MSISGLDIKEDDYAFEKTTDLVDVENLDKIFENWDKMDNLNQSKLLKTKNDPKKRRNNHREILNELASLIPIHGVCPQVCLKNCKNNALGADTCLLLKYVITYLRLKQVINGSDFGISRIRSQNIFKNEMNNIFDILPMDKYPNAIPIVLSNSFECLYISMGIYYLTGITQASIIGKSILEFIHPDNNIASLFSNNVKCNYYKSSKTLQFNEIDNLYFNECICNNSFYGNDYKETKFNDPYKNLQRKRIGIRFKSTITYQGINLLKQGSYCYIDMNLMFCIRNIRLNLDDNNSNLLSKTQFLIGILIPFYMPKILKYPSQSIYFHSFHKLCLQTQLITPNQITLLNEHSQQFSWYSIIHPLHVKRLQKFHKEIGFSTFTLFRLKDLSHQLVSKGYLYNCPKNSNKLQSNQLIVLSHEIVSNFQKSSDIENINENIELKTKCIKSSICDRIPFILSNDDDVQLFM